MADWSNLPEDLTIPIAERLVFMEDFIAFDAVCKSWRSPATKKAFASRSRLTHQVPLIMLPKAKGAARINFATLRKVGKKGKIYVHHVPETKENLCFSSLGWFLTLSKDSKFNLLLPFSHPQIKLPLPDIKTAFSRRKAPSMIKKFALSSSPSWTSDYVVMICYPLIGKSRFAFCRPRDDENWTSLASENDDSRTRITDLTYYKGQFYAVCVEGSIFVCDIKEAKTRVVVPIAPPRDVVPPRKYIKTVYLVESAGALLVVFDVVDEGQKKTISFQVFEIDFSHANWRMFREVTNLGNRTLFLSRYTNSFSIESSNHSECKANCIYFMNNGICFFQEEDLDMGIFNMEDGKIEPLLGISLDDFFQGSLSGLNSNLWIQPGY